MISSKWFSIRYTVMNPNSGPASAFQNFELLYCTRQPTARSPYFLTALVHGNVSEGFSMEYIVTNLDILPRFSISPNILKQTSRIALHNSEPSV